MGFGFNLFCLFVLLPLTGILFLFWIISRRKIFGKAVGQIWLGVFGLILLVGIIRFFTEKKELDRKDIYGAYIIDRTKFPGKQADWQYNHFRFEITKQNKFIFYRTENDKVIKTDTGTVEFLSAYRRPRIVLKVSRPRHHIIEETPTLYRTVWGFYYVFNSPKFGNVFFTRGKWKPIDK